MRTIFFGIALDKGVFILLSEVILVALDGKPFLIKNLASFASLLLGASAINRFKWCRAITFLPTSA